ncbi:SH3 domain-containing protein [Streptomyces sp. NPDC006475]|uniref:SH3 domain-containing protein n=1 Tax=Streptomyces sp. NPDC006475 TaxID=3155719 RepID=UPI0033A076F9
MKLKNRISALAVTTVVVVGGALAGAPSAAAVPAACDWEWAWPQTNNATATVHLRSGPGSGYTSKGLLQKGIKFQETCNKNFAWGYGKVLTGANRGKWGWVAKSYMV